MPQTDLTANDYHAAWDTAAQATAEGWQGTLVWPADLRQARGVLDTVMVEDLARLPTYVGPVGPINGGMLALTPEVRVVFKALRLRQARLLGLIQEKLGRHETIVIRMADGRPMDPRTRLVEPPAELVRVGPVIREITYAGYHFARYGFELGFVAK